MGRQGKPFKDRVWKQKLFWLALSPIIYAPHWLRYRFADGLAWLLRYGLKYRHKVIDENLMIAFPEKSDEERLAIRHAFYRNFADLAIEQIWAFGASREQMLASVSVDQELLDEFEKHRRAGRPVMIAAGHHNNYELGAAALAMHIPIPMATIYARLVNPFFDARVRESRSRFDMVLWPRGQTDSYMIDWHQKYGSFGVGFAFDQSPHAGRYKFWFPFFNRVTAVQKGLDIYAQRFGAAVMFLYLERLDRGKYRVRHRLLTEDASLVPFGLTTARATHELELVIRKDPGGWMWSHRRWKLNPEEHTLDEDIYVDVELKSAHDALPPKFEA